MRHLRRDWAIHVEIFGSAAILISMFVLDKYSVSLKLGALSEWVHCRKEPRAVIRIKHLIICTWMGKARWNCAVFECIEVMNWVRSEKWQISIALRGYFAARVIKRVLRTTTLVAENRTLFSALLFGDGARKYSKFTND